MSTEPHSDPVPGRATPEGTERFRRRFPRLDAAGHFRSTPAGLSLSSIGLGTYLGEPDDATDASYEESVLAALREGCNVFDTAVNYRHQRSERALGRALRRAFDEGLAARDEVFVSTKGGYLPFDGAVPADPGAYLRRAYLDSGLLRAQDLAAGCHAMTPAYLDDQLGRSLANLGLAAVDLYYLHNPETQLGEIPAEEFHGRVEAAFEALEAARREGRAGGYGAATWQGLRQGPAAPGHLSLARLLAAARRAGGAEHGFTAAQLPLNLAMPEALAAPTQEHDGAVIPLLTAARAAGVMVFTSASILQGRLAGGLPPEVAEAFPEAEGDAPRALQFTRSAPGVTTALVGMSDPAHARQNLALAAVAPATAEQLRRLFSR